MLIRVLAQDDDRSRFRSGNIDLDRFFQRFGGQNQFRHHVGVTYVAVDGTSIRGFVTVAAASVVTSAAPAGQRRKLPSYLAVIFLTTSGARWPTLTFPSTCSTTSRLLAHLTM